MEKRNALDGPTLEPRKKSSHAMWWVLVALIVVGGLAYWGVERRQASGGAGAKAGGAPPPVPVLAGMVEEKNVPVYLEGLGTVQAFNTVTVRARVDGELKKVSFVEGQDVHAGDVLAQIDPDPYQAALDQAKAKKGEDEAQLMNAQIGLKRETELLAAKIDAQQVYDTQKALTQQLDATVKADQAAVQSAQVNLNYTTIISPIDGLTGIRAMDQGNIVHAADSNGIVVLTQLQPISLVFTLPEQVLDSIHREMPQDVSKMKVQAMGRDNNEVLDEGTLTVIDNQVDTSTGTIRLKASLPNQQRRLWPGQFVNARLLLTVRTNGLVVPTAAIQRGPTGAYIFVIEPGSGNAGNSTNNVGGGKSKAREGNTSTTSPKTSGKKNGAGKPGSGNEANANGGTNQPPMHVKIQPVTVAPEVSGPESLITKGLQKGERIVVDGQYKLQDGSPVRITMGTNNASVQSGPKNSLQ